MKYIDSQGMRQAMLESEVGDDVYGEDPTVNKLQDKVASLFGKEAALFVPSGVMGNQVCIRVHTNHGDEIITDEDAHIFVYENAAPAALSGVSVKTVHGDNGVITAEQIKKALPRKTGFTSESLLLAKHKAYLS
ncbi:MAG: beta-eliminating lyase-related protein [Bacteroidota bacterium]